jgi:hypothetical protein
MRLALLSLFLLACSNNAMQGMNIYESEAPPARLAGFCSEEDGPLMFKFMLQDENGFDVVSDGILSLIITDDNGSTLYSREMIVARSDFSQFRKRGLGMGRIIEIYIPANASSRYGNATALFTNDKMSMNTTLRYVPLFSFSA